MAATTSLSLSCIAIESLFCVRWIRKTIRNVITVVTVLATSCHVSDQWNSGPVTNQRRIDSAARMNALVDPLHRVDQLANRSNMYRLQGRGCLTAGNHRHLTPTRRQPA